MNKDHPLEHPRNPVTPVNPVNKFRSLRARQFKGLILLILTAAVLSFPGPIIPGPRRALCILTSNAPPYRENLDGIKARFEGKIDVAVMDADTARLAASIASDPPGLIFAIGSSAAEFAARRGQAVLFSMVYYPERHGLTGRENVAGLSLRVPPGKVVEALEAVRPRGKEKLRVGVLYPAGRDDAELKAIIAALSRYGHVAVPRLVAAGQDPGPAFLALLQEIDALWLVADPAVLPGPDFLKSMLNKALDKKVAVIGLSDAHVRTGALLAVSVDYRLEGETAARLGAEIIVGKSPSSIGILAPQNLAWSLNTKVAEEIGWQVPRPARQRFERVYP
ncbi:MAG TPA: ABC transporter substrate binding protein [bacterium]|nr:ABC transporter substrate binding protein [bacterium]